MLHLTIITTLTKSLTAEAGPKQVSDVSKKRYELRERLSLTDFRGFSFQVAVPTSYGEGLFYPILVVQTKANPALPLTNSVCSVTTGVFCFLSRIKLVPSAM